MTRKFEIPVTEYPFSSNWLSFRDADLHYVDTGTGMPVIMLHGNPTWSFLYRNVIKAISPYCRAIAPDYPGFGYSGHPPGYDYTAAEHAEAILALIDHLKLDRFMLVVQDWGGPIGMSVATQRSACVAGLVICNTWSWPLDGWSVKLFSRVLGGPIGRWLILRRNFFAKTLMSAALGHSEAPSPAICDAYSAPFPDLGSRMGTYVFPRELTAAHSWLEQLESALPLLKDVPVEFVWGMKDPLFRKPEYLQRWRKHFPAAPIEELEDAGHFLQEDRPDRVAAAVLRLLERTGPPQSEPG